MCETNKRAKKDPICELCSVCESGQKCNKTRRACLVCEKPFCGTGYNYYDKHFCSVVCMKIMRTIDIEEEDRVREEREKTLVKINSNAGYCQGGGSAY